MKRMRQFTGYLGGGRAAIMATLALAAIDGAVGLAANRTSGRPAESTPTPTEDLPFDSNPNTP